jgi:glycosyltransferase involved in cell wall biosynthesis
LLERRILIVTTSFPRTVDDGSEAAGAFVADFAVALSRWLQVRVLAPDAESSTHRLGSVAIRYFSAPKLPLSLLKPWSPSDWTPIVRTLRAGDRSVEALVEEEGVDHVLALWALPCGNWARRAARRARVGYSVWGLGSDIWTLGRIPFVRGVLKSVLRGAAHRFADGIRLASDIHSIAGKACEFLPSSRVLPVLRERPVSLDPPYRLAFLGRWHHNKGADLLLDALLRLDDADWRRVESVRIAGGGPLEGRVTISVKALRRSGRSVMQMGYLDRDRAAELFEWADFVLLPSRIESIPVVFSDAVQAGRPLICTPVGDLPRLMNRYGCGILAKSPAGSDIAAAIRQALLSGPEGLLGGLAEAAHDFDVQVTAKRVVETIFGETRRPADE